MNKRVYSINDWMIENSSGSIVQRETGERKRLGEYQLRLLEVLAEHAGKILTREELTLLVWERRIIGTNSLPNAIHALRLALEDDGKQQRIIKTIPKKGYLLEPELCQVIIVDDVEPPSHDVIALKSEVERLPVDNKEADFSGQDVDIPLSHQTGTPLSQTSTTVLKQRGKTHSAVHLLSLFFIGILLGVSYYGWQLRKSSTPMIQVKDYDRGIYSQIRLHQIVDPETPEGNSDEFYVRIKDSLYSLNQKMEAQSQRMAIYYHADAQKLNLTLVVKNKCSNKQLIMTIYHWRIDDAQLNKLIMKETERKISELTSCSAA